MTVDDGMTPLHIWSKNTTKLEPNVVEFTSIRYPLPGPSAAAHRLAWAGRAPRASQTSRARSSTSHRSRRTGAGSALDHEATILNTYKPQNNTVDTKTQSPVSMWDRPQSSPPPPPHGGGDGPEGGPGRAGAAAGGRPAGRSPPRPADTSIAGRGGARAHPVGRTCLPPGKASPDNFGRTGPLTTSSPP